MTASVPTFAVVGAVNHGKSSVVSALAEDDGVRVSSMPGETVDNQRFGLRDLFVLIDTPGFQNARKALAELTRLAGEASIDAVPERSTGDPSLDRSGDPLVPFRRFLELHRDDPAFDAECRLLQPIVAGAGVIYVVDASGPLRDLHRSEMEILRRTGAPRLAIVNRAGPDDQVERWKRQLDQHFNLVRTFDAHHVTRADRIDLIESLMGIERRWKDRLAEALRRMEASRVERLVDTAVLFVDLLVDCLRHTESSPLADTRDDRSREALAETTKQRYLTTVVAMEAALHRRIIALFEHHHVRPDAMPTALFDSGLFADTTWHLFGLGAQQLVGLATVAGGLAGAGVDAATLGHSFGLGAVLGAATGGGGAWMLGKRRPELSIGWPTGGLPDALGAAATWLGRRGLRLGGGDLVVGPFRAENFPWILLDRALCVFAAVYTRSHARRDVAIVDVRTLLPVLDRTGVSVAHWPDADRRRCQAIFREWRGRRMPTSEQRSTLRDLFVARLEAVADAERVIAASERPVASTAVVSPIR